jgi:hypothetical protein
MDKKSVQVNIPVGAYDCIRNDLQEDESTEHWILTAIFEKLIANSKRSSSELNIPH